MERYYSKKAKTTQRIVEESNLDVSKELPAVPTLIPSQLPQSSIAIQAAELHSSKSPSFVVSGISLQADPGLRQRLSSFHPNIQDEIRRAYIEKGPCQPRGHSFPFKDICGNNRRFNPSWFDAYHWLEYSTAKDAAYCLHCYLFKQEGNVKQGGGDCFTGNGFSSWNKADRLLRHVGATNSSHNDCVRKCNALMKQSQSIAVAINKQDDQSKKDYRTRLEASTECIAWLIRNGCPLRGHDESMESNNRGLFLELLKFYSRGREHIQSVVLQNAPKNLQMTSPDIQKDIVHALAAETTKLIVKDIGDDVFSILVDEARVLRYVDKTGSVVERFLSISHVANTKALTLRNEIESMLLKHGLSFSKIRGQGYDGASNMKGEINGLKTLILSKTPSAYYIHYFAHQAVSVLTNLVGASCKRRDIVRETQAEKVADAISCGETETGRGLNQEISLKRPSDTRWGSHFATLVNLELMFSSLIEVLDVIQYDGDSVTKGEAIDMLQKLETFNFVLILKLMIGILSITNDLSIALQKKDQDIVNAMHLVNVAKQRLQHLRDCGWESLLDDVVAFCVKEGIKVVEMNDAYVPPGRSRRKGQQVTSLHHFRVEVFYTVVDMQLQELNNRFDEVNCELLCSMACLSPKNSFGAFNKEKLMCIAAFYPDEFSSIQMRLLGHQLDSYIFDLPSDERFHHLKGIDDLAKKMVETEKHNVYPLVYLLIKLTLILPVATASVERAFSAMSYIKNKLRNRMGDQWLNDTLVVYIERDMTDRLNTECVIQHFQNMKSRRGSL
ncbi:Zinc finger MYM-type protein 1 [Linum perenne]